ENDMVIAGHGRLAAAKLLKMSEVPVVRLEHMTEAQKRAYIIADNRIAEKAGWDKDILAIELQFLIDQEDLTFDPGITGFETAEIDFMIDGIDKKQDPLDEVPAVEEQAPAVTKTGDLYIMGNHR